MNRMVYVLPETVGSAIIELFGVAATVAIIVGYFTRNPTIDKYVHMILQRTKVLDLVSTDSDADPQSELLGVRVSRVFTYGLVLYIAWLLFGAAIVFLDAFLIEVTNSCDPSASRANCFLNTGFFNISAFFDKPIDCNNLRDVPDNTTFICYRYTLNLGVAAGTAGAYFATGMMFMKLFAACYVHKHSPKYLNIIKHSHMWSGTILITIAAAVVHAVPQLRHILTEGSLIALLHYIHMLISQVILHVLFMLPIYQKTDNEHTNKKASDYHGKTGTGKKPAATPSRGIQMTTLPHEQSTKSQEYGHDHPTRKRN